MQKRSDIFCRIIDNYGDIGVCWRLARQLTREHNFIVRLWVDDLQVAARLIPNLDPKLARQAIDGVEIGHWQQNFPETEIADVVIEAFACELPQDYVTGMVRKKPVWINLEYLSAESWVEGFHLQASPHPTLPLTKYFFCPGFTEKTGGLLRESALIKQRNQWQGSTTSQAAFWHKFGIEQGARKVSLFCYPHAPMVSLLQAMAEGEQTTALLVPQSAIVHEIAAHLGLVGLKAGDQHHTGKLRLYVLPFLSQDEYDRLLWSCDLNFVRGEDSWVRAIWAAKPFIWQPYRQEDGAHFKKLEAFLDLYAGNQPVLQQSHYAWLGNGFTSALWDTLLDELDSLRNHAAKQSEALQKHADLAAKLVIFCKNYF